MSFRVAPGADNGWSAMVLSWFLLEIDTRAVSASERCFYIAIESLSSAGICASNHLR